MAVAAADTEAAKIRIVVETPAGLSQRVYLSRPPALGPDRPVVFVLHGEDRAAAECRDAWRELAAENNFLVVVPEFSERHFPGAEGYSQGNLYDAGEKLQPRAAWSFSVIEPIFDDVRLRYGMTARGYGIYGHGAGAEFVHRFLYHVPRARVTGAVAASAAWYTMPTFGASYPYGLRAGAVRPDDLRAVLRLPLTVLLAETDSASNELVTQPPDEALAQGPNALARGQAFFDAAADGASSLKVSFGWQLTVAAGVPRGCGPVAPAMVPLLLGPPPPAGTEPPAETLPTVLPRTGP